MKKNLFVLSFGLVAALALLTLGSAQAAFDLNYSLTEGGLRMELNPLDAYKGANISVTTDIGVRYEVIQKIIRPLENRDKPGVIITDNFTLRALRGTNRFGTLHVPTNDSTVRNNETLYTSDTAGNADSLTLVYGITNTENIEAGYYYGKIAFVLSPINSTQAQVTKFLDVYVSITKEAEAKPRIEITTSSGSKIISLNSKNAETQSADVIIKINGTFKNIFNIAQLLAKPLESREGKRLDYEAVNFQVKEARAGSGEALTALSAQPQRVYTSAAGGGADAYFIVTYAFGDLAKQKAGRYTTSIQYILDEAGLQTKLETLALEVENERIFDLLITPQDQMSRIEFRNLKPKEEPKISEVVVEIKSNTGKQYQVGQNIYSGLTDKEGRKIAPENFNIRTEALPGTKGTIRIPQKSEVKTGETALFVSDRDGSSDKFKVIYELSAPPDLIAGDYSSRITYSLTEI